MEKHKNSAVWSEAGYDLFAREGLDGIQVERLARIVKLNKSGFYHYFGDLEGFFRELLNLHKKKIDLFVQEINHVKRLDPDYLHLVIRHASMVMFQVQLVRHPNNHVLYAPSELVDEKVRNAVRQLWYEYLDLPVDSDLGVRYYAIIQDMFYTRISMQDMNYAFLHNLITDAKAILVELSTRGTLVTN